MAETRGFFAAAYLKLKLKNMESKHSEGCLGDKRFCDLRQQSMGTLVLEIKTIVCQETSTGGEHSFFTPQRDRKFNKYRKRNLVQNIVRRYSGTYNYLTDGQGAMTVTRIL